MTIGKVYLVGAGPGDPDLITRKGWRLIQSADVVIYDRLIPAELLDETRPDAVLINAGKAPQKHRLNQDDINQAIVDHALAGKSVVRLKGGDPFVFGRGSEEALACRSAGVDFEIVPGISSSYAVPAYAGIPLTHRNVSRSFTVITGHTAPDDPANAIDYSALVRSGGTLVMLMGVKQLAAITAELISAGLSPETPAAIIEWGATINQRTVTGTVATLTEQARAIDIQPPATVVIGEVVRLRSAGVAWYDHDWEQIALPQAGD